MYAIYGKIYHQYTPNVSIYTIHGSYGYCQCNLLQIPGLVSDTINLWKSWNISMFISSHWIENLQETMVFTIKYGGFPESFPKTNPLIIRTMKNHEESIIKTHGPLVICQIAIGKSWR